MRRQCRDYIEKPANPEEVASRIKLILLNGEADTLPSTAVFRRKGGDAMIIEWCRPGREKKREGGQAR